MTLVLVVEDNEMNRDMLTRRLERKGLAVECAVDGPDGIRMAGKVMPDIVLMDMNMPAISGLDVARMYRFTHTDHPHLPIVALTAEATEQARRQCADAGMDAFLTKPVDPADLLAALDDALAHVRGQQPA